VDYHIGLGTAKLDYSCSDLYNPVLMYLLIDLSTRLRHQMLVSLQAFPAVHRYSRYIKPMREADGLQTFFVHAAM